MYRAFKSLFDSKHWSYRNKLYLTCFALTGGYYLTQPSFGQKIYSQQQAKNVQPTSNYMTKLNPNDIYPTFCPQKSTSQKPHVVILGSGWGAVSLIKNLSKQYSITVVSPTNYFLFTPLIPSSIVGTTQINSLTEPIRNILRKAGWYSQDDQSPVECNYVEASAVDMEYQNQFDYSQQRVLVETYSGDKFWIPFDKCVIAVGSKSVTFGVEGVDKYCNFLKNVDDVRKIKSKLIQNFEKAALPITSDEHKKKLLTFVFCGGGPTACEAAAEIYDFLSEDLSKSFPHLKQYVKLYIIQSQDHILNTYDQKISVYAQQKFTREGINLLLKSRVTKVEDGNLWYDYMKENSKEKQTGQLQFGLCIWTTGVGMQPFTENLVNRIPYQEHSRALIVDDHLRLKGVYQGFPSGSDNGKAGNIFAIGDCSTVEIPKLINKILNLFTASDKDKSNSLSFEEFEKLAQKLRRKYPQTQLYLNKLSKLFKEYDQNNSGSLEYQEFEKMVLDINNKLKSYPATAQVAQQQGKYVASFLNYMMSQNDDNRFYRLKNNLSNLFSSDQDDDDQDDLNSFPAFFYHHLGSLTYLGTSAAAIDFGQGLTLGSSDKGGIFGKLMVFWLWRSVYLSEVVSLRQRMKLAQDWFMTSFFGREIARS